MARSASLPNPFAKSSPGTQEGETQPTAQPQPQQSPQPQAQAASLTDAYGLSAKPSWQTSMYDNTISNQRPAMTDTTPQPPPTAPTPPPPAFQQGGAYAQPQTTSIDPLFDSKFRATFDPESYVMGGYAEYVPRMTDALQSNAHAGAAAQYGLANNTFGIGQNVNAALSAQGQSIAGQAQGAASALGQSAGGIAQTAQGMNAAAGAATQRGEPVGASAMYRTGLTAEQMATQQRGTAAMDFGMQNSMLGRAEGGAAALGGLESQQGPSAAQAQLALATNQNMANTAALAASGRGYGGGTQARAEALRANAATGLQAANQSAALSAQENAAWRQRQAANLGASSQLQQGIAGQYGGATAAAMDSYIRQQAQNDARVQGLLGVSQQGFAGYNQAALAARGQNDAYSAQLYGLGLQGQTAAQDAQLAAANLGLQGSVAGAGVQAQGAQLGIGANQTAAGMTAEGTGQINAGLLSGAQLAQSQMQAEMAREQAAMQYYGIRNGIAIQNAQMQNNLIGSGIQAAGTALAGGAMLLSDVRAKKNVRPLGEGEDESYQYGGVSTALPMSSMYDPYDSGLGEGIGGPMLGPDEDQYATSMAAAARAQEREDSLASNRRAKGFSMLANAAGQIGQGMSSGSQSNPLLDAYMPRGSMVSDERAKESLRSAEMAPGYAYEYRDPERHGEGTHYGPMAQDLARTPAGRATLSESEDGYLQVDTGKLAMQTHAGLGELSRRENMRQQELGELARQVAAIREEFANRSRGKRRVA